MANLKLKVDEDLCTGCQVCCDTAPKTFRLKDAGVAEAFNPQGDDDDTIMQAAQSCPVDAISVVNGDSGDKLWPK